MPASSVQLLPQNKIEISAIFQTQTRLKLFRMFNHWELGCVEPKKTRQEQEEPIQSLEQKEEPIRVCYNKHTK